MAAYYDMVCDSCGNAFELEKASIHDPFPKKCRACGKMSLRQDYSGLNQVCQMGGNSVGGLAERNRKKISKEQIELERPKTPETFWDKSFEDRTKVFNEKIKDVKVKRKRRGKDR